MALKLFNTLTRSVQEFTPLDPQKKKVGMYCCGPTVYDFAHIGNWRTFVFADLVRRTIREKGDHADLDNILALDAERRKALSDLTMKSAEHGPDY